MDLDIKFSLRVCLDWGGKDGEWRRVELVENKLISGQIYSTLLPLLPSIQTDHMCLYLKKSINVLV